MQIWRITVRHEPILLLDPEMDQRSFGQASAQLVIVPASIQAEGVFDRIQPAHL
jgi:hypothetical protein